MTNLAMHLGQSSTRGNQDAVGSSGWSLHLKVHIGYDEMQLRVAVLPELGPDA
jgi:hypothetical protein